MPATPDPGFAVYVHWPFCLSLCPYCDFNSHVAEGIDQARWRAAFLAELGHWAGTTAGRVVTSLFFGGGTPSLMAPETVAALVAEVRRRWPVADDLEVTLEANPSSAEAGRFAAYRAAGVNRISLGVQALDDAALAWLGRRHDSAEALAAVAVAGRHFPRLSFDLITGRPGQTVASWRAELARALDHAGEHLSVYHLTMEPGTPMAAAHARGAFELPGEDLSLALYEATEEVLSAAGYGAYEVSNHARPGAECRHNLTYWRYGDYVGIGPGAHGRLTREDAKIATRQHRAPAAWLAAVEASGHATREEISLGRRERLEELLLMGLRLSEGVGEDAIRRETGRGLDEALDPERLSRLVEGGFLAVEGAAPARTIRTTPAGRRRLDAVLAALLA